MSKRAKKLISKKTTNEENKNGDGGFKSAFEFLPPKEKIYTLEDDNKKLKRSNKRIKRSTVQKEDSSINRNITKTKTRELIDGSAFLLPLPDSYKVLEEVFIVIDNACNLMLKRHQPCSFDKLKEIVSTSLKKTITDKDMSQILYIARWDMNKKIESQKENPTTKQIEEKEDKEEKSNKFFNLTQFKTKEMHSIKETLQYVLLPVPSYYTSDSITQRKLVFHQNLLKIVNFFHTNFLNKTKKVTPKVTSKELPKSWDKDFNMEREIKPIPIKPLEDYLQKDDSLNNSASISPVKKPEISLFQEKTNNSIIENVDVKDILETHKDLKDVPISLLKKVKARQIELEQQKKNKPSEVLTRLQTLSLLPDLCKKLKSFYTSDKVDSMFFDIIFEKIATGVNRQAEKENFQAQINLLCEILPDWCSIMDKDSKRKVIKLNFPKNNKITSVNGNSKSKKLKDVLAVIQKEIDKINLKEGDLN